MIIDLHLHEELFSSCSVMPLADAVSAARKKGLDGIGITNHNSLDIRDDELLKEADFPVFVGVEYFADEGEIIAFGVEAIPNKRVSAQEFINCVNEQGGFCFAAHPFRVGCGLAENLFTLQGLHGIEVCNGSNLDSENEKAWGACHQLGLVAVGGSDAHRPLLVGRYATRFSSTITSMKALVASLKSGACCPVAKDSGGVWQDVKCPTETLPRYHSG